MIRANRKEKSLVVDILTQSFENNGSVNYVVKQSANRIERIRKLINYSFEVCNAYGDVWISYDEKACALVLYPDKKRTTLSSIFWDIKLAVTVIGLSRIGKVLKRESKIKAHHPKASFSYLWFIGVLPKKQNQGIGSKFLEDVVHESWIRKRPVYLETSVERNIPWYLKHGFEMFEIIQFDKPLHMLRREDRK